MRSLRAVVVALLTLFAASSPAPAATTRRTSRAFWECYRDLVSTAVPIYPHAGAPLARRKL